MARSNIADWLTVYPFWLMDLAPLEQSALPVFTPLLGFSEITSPELQLEVTAIPEGNSYFIKKTVKRGNMSPMNIRRGAQFIDSDFWRWTMSALSGNTSITNTTSTVLPYTIGGPTYRRDLVLIHFFSRLPTDATDPTNIANQISAALGNNTPSTIASSILGGFGMGPVDIAPRLPARAWILYGCIPSRYKSGSDFNASASDISMVEMTVEVEAMEEVSLAS